MEQKLIDTKEFMKKLTEEIDAVSSEDYDGEKMAEYDWASGWWISTKVINKVLESTPAIDAEPVRHGKWTERKVITVNKEEWQSAKCSVCGKYHTTPYMYYFSDYDYCPDCGAKMDEIEEWVFKMD